MTKALILPSLTNHGRSKIAFDECLPLAALVILKPSCATNDLHGIRAGAAPRWQSRMRRT